MIDPTQYLKRRAKFTRNERAELEQWLRDCGWQFKTFPDRPRWNGWLPPGDRISDWTLAEAVRWNAVHEVAKRLRALGWFCPHEFGTYVVGNTCRAPGTFELRGNEFFALRGTGGKWLSLAAAAKQAGLIDFDSALLRELTRKAVKRIAANDVQVMA